MFLWQPELSREGLRPALVVQMSVLLRVLQSALLTLLAGKPLCGNTGSLPPSGHARKEQGHSQLSAVSGESAPAQGLQGRRCRSTEMLKDRIHRSASLLVLLINRSSEAVRRLPQACPQSSLPLSDPFFML